MRAAPGVVDEAVGSACAIMCASCDSETSVFYFHNSISPACQLALMRI